MRANTHKRECSETVLFPKCGVELRFVLYAKRLLHLQNALSSGISIGQQVLSQTLPNDLNHALAWPLRYKGKPIAKSSFNQQSFKIIGETYGCRMVSFSLKELAKLGLCSNCSQKLHGCSLARARKILQLLTCSHSRLNVLDCAKISLVLLCSYFFIYKR